MKMTHYCFLGFEKIHGFDVSLMQDAEGAIGVYPIDTANAQRLRRVKIGEPVVFTEKGTIKKRTIKKIKGRSR